jgi:sulfur-carrier protein
MSNITVKIPTPLRPLTSGQSEVKVEGTTVGEILRKLDSQFKGFGERVLDDGKNVKRFINVFVNEDNIRDKKELDTEVKAGDTISILPSIAGGAAANYANDAIPFA